MSLARKLTATWAGALALLIAWQYLVNAPEAKKQLESLRVEFNQMAPMPSSIKYSFEDKQGPGIGAYKPNLAVVEAAYGSPLSCKETFAYYDKELARNGWQFGRQIMPGSTMDRKYIKRHFRASVICGGGSGYKVIMVWFGPYGGLLGLSVYVGTLAFSATLWFGLPAVFSATRSFSG